MNKGHRPTFVHLISHGPHCLDGVTAAVVVTRYHRTATVLPSFSSNPRINETLLGLQCQPLDAEHEVWITDISWTDPAVDSHLQRLIDRGVRIYWIDHHRTAIERFRGGTVRVQLTDIVLSEAYAASRLTYGYLRDRLTAAGETNQPFFDLERLVAMADDNDRWCHQIPGSRELARTVAAMHDDEAYRELVRIDANVTYTAPMHEAAERVEGELQRSFALAEQSRVTHGLPHRNLRLIAALCDGHPSEIADAWGKTSRGTIFALYDVRALSVSLRRSPDCEVDLSQIACRLGGGGHAAAAGCELIELRGKVAEMLAAAVIAAVA